MRPEQISRARELEPRVRALTAMRPSPQLVVPEPALDDVSVRICDGDEVRLCADLRRAGEEPVEDVN